MVFPLGANMYSRPRKRHLVIEVVEGLQALNRGGILPLGGSSEDRSTVRTVRVG